MDRKRESGRREEELVLTTQPLVLNKRMKNDSQANLTEGRAIQVAGEAGSGTDQYGEGVGGEASKKKVRQCDGPHGGKAHLVGARFGRWTLIGFDYRIKKRHYWKGKCDCGHEGVRLLRNILQGQSKSCGCQQNAKRLDFTGQRIGRLTVLSFFGKKPNRTAHFWNCVCDCGKHTVVNQQRLHTKATNSCGCLRKELASAANTTHGHSHGHGWNGRHSCEYRTWMSMKARCQNPKNKRYRDYGGRGIVICERWQSFALFLEDMGSRPDGMSIERIKNELGYFKENCKWATRSEQQNNMRRNRVIKFQGESRNLTQWARILNIKPNAISTRLDRGWSVEDALSRPISGRGRVSSTTMEVRKDESHF